MTKIVSLGRTGLVRVLYGARRFLIGKGKMPFDAFVKTSGALLLLACAGCSGTHSTYEPSPGATTVDSYEDLFATPPAGTKVTTRFVDGLYVGTCSESSMLDLRVKMSSGTLWVGGKHDGADAFGFSVEYQARGETIVILRSGSAEQGEQQPKKRLPSEPVDEDASKGYARLELAAGESHYAITSSGKLQLPLKCTYRTAGATGGASGMPLTKISD